MHLSWPSLKIIHATPCIVHYAATAYYSAVSYIVTPLKRPSQEIKYLRGHKNAWDFKLERKF